MALKLIACVLLLEITTFLRECYRTLPKPSKLVRYAQQPAVDDPSLGRPSGYFQWSDSRAQSRDHPPQSAAGSTTAGVTGGMVAVVASAPGGAVPSGTTTVPAAGGGATSSGRRWSMAAQSIAG